MQTGRSLAIAAAIFLLSICPARANDKTAIVAVIIKATAAFDRGDVKTFRPLLAPSQSVIDDVPPHYWSGPRAVLDWNATLHAAGGASMTDPSMSLHPSAFILVDGNRAWAPMPATFTYRDGGALRRQTGTLTFALQKIAGRWKILGFAWARLS